jgi:mucosa-associated lymphoid tissue lymphoma translocation protein 1
MTSHGVYVIIHNLEKNLDDPAVVCVGHQGKEFIIEDGCGTNRNYLQTWMTAVSITESVMGSGSTTLTPSAIMVGTHYDIIKQQYPNLSERAEFLTAKEAAIDRVVNRFPLFQHFRRPFFYVDNLFTCDDAMDQLRCVRKKIVNLALEDKQSEGLIPFSWLRFEVDVYTESSSNPNGYWSYQEAIEKASRCFSLQNLGNEEHFQSMFQFYHRLGVIMWFGESAALSKYVVINPQLLLNLFRSIITLDPVVDNRKGFWTALRNTGILGYKHVDQMLEESIFANQKITAVDGQRDISERKDFLLKMLQMFGLSVPYFQSSSAVNDFHSGSLSRSSQFLIPSMVSQDLPVESFAEGLDSCPTIYLTSLHRLVPVALYSRLVVYLVRLFPLCPAIYKKFARLHIDKNYDLLLFNINTEQSGRIKLAIQRLCCDATVAQSVSPSRILNYVVHAIADIKSQGMQGLQFMLEIEVTCRGTQPVHQHFFPALDFQCNRHDHQSCADPVCCSQSVLARDQGSKRAYGGVHVRCGVNQCPNGLQPRQCVQHWFENWDTYADSKHLVEVCIVSGSFEAIPEGDVIAGDIIVTEGGGKDVGHHRNVTVVPDLPLGTIQLHCSVQRCDREAETSNYFWLKGGVLVGEGRCLELKSFNSDENSGVYCCQVVSRTCYSYSQPVFIQTAPGKLILKEPPAVEIYIVSATLRRVKEKSPVSLGQSIQLACTAQPVEPDTKLYYRWFQNKLPIPNAVDSSFVIESVQDFHDGLYHCVVSDHPVDPARMTSSSICSSDAEIIIASHNWLDDECWFQHQINQRRKQIQVDMYKKCRAKAKDKVALLIGNREYTRMKGDLHFPENDVVAVADALRCLGFKVLVYVNVNFFEMCHVLQMFYELVQQGVYAVFYFAGHGFEFNRETYIMPVDADLGNIKTSFRETAIEYALQEHGARLGLLLLDCCRVWPGYSGSKCVLPSLGVGNMITQYSCCSLNPAYEVSKAGSNHSVYACQLRKVLEKLAAAGNMQQGTGHDSKIGSQMVGQRTEDSVDSGQASTVASMPAQAVGDSFNLSVQNMLEVVAIAVNDERVSQRQGGRDTPWQVPQLRQHIIETDLSLADQVETEGSIARQNDRYYQALSSLIPTGKNIQKIAGSCPVCQVYLSYEMWTANVLLIGINVIPQDQNLTNKLKVEMQVKFDVCR